MAKRRRELDAAHCPGTAAVRALRDAAVEFEPHLYAYVPHGGTAQSAQALGVDEHTVVKTLVMEDDARAPLLVLMHGDHEVSTKALARELGVKHVEPCTQATAERLTGYQVGGISPFGTRQAMPVYAQASIRSLDRLLINGGRRGFLVAIAPIVLEQILEVGWVDVAR